MAYGFACAKEGKKKLQKISPGASSILRKINIAMCGTSYVYSKGVKKMNTGQSPKRGIFQVCPELFDRDLRDEYCSACFW